MATRPPGKKPSLNEVLVLLESLHGAPLYAERPDDPLLDHLLVGVLALHAGVTKAREALRALSQTYLDFNELRVSPKSQIAAALEPYVPAERLPQAAWDLRMAIQDVYDATHGLDLEPLRGRDPEDLKHFATKLPNTAGGPAALVFQLAVGEKHLVLGPLEAHLLDRLGMLPRASTPQRVRLAMEKQIKPGDRLRFAWITGASAHLHETSVDLDSPFGRMLVDCRAKELALREKQKKQDEVRRKADEKRRVIEAAKQARLDAIAAKKRAAEDKQKAAVAEQKRKKDEAAKAVIQKRLAEKARILEAKRKQQESVAAAKKAAAAKQVAEAAAKKAALHKAQQQKLAAAKAAAQKAQAAAKKAAAKKRS